MKKRYRKKRQQWLKLRLEVIGKMKSMGGQKILPAFYNIGNFVPYVIKTLRGDAHNVQGKAASQPHIGAQSGQVPHG